MGDVSRNRSLTNGKVTDGITSKFKSRSVSLTRADAKKILPPKKLEKPERKQKTPPKISPKNSVLERKSRFEKVQEKYRTQRCLKEIKEKAKTELTKTKKEKNSKTSSEDSDESIASLLKIIHADIKVMKSDLKENTVQITSMNSKITAIENDNAIVESETNLKFQAIRYDMGMMESSVTSKVMNELDLKLSTMRSELREDLNSHIRRLVQEEIQLQKLKEKKDKA